MAFSQRTLGLTTVLVVLAVLGGAFWWWVRPIGDGPEQAEASAADSFGIEVAQTSELAASIAQTVVGAEVVRGTLWVTVHPRATARALRQTTVATQVEGVVQELLVRENSAVAEDQPLVQLDTAELALEVAVERSNHRQAEADYEARMVSLAPDEDPEVRERFKEQARARSGLDAADVSLRQAELRLERTTVRAPFAGRVADVQVVVGQHVSAGTEVMSVLTLDPIRVEAEVLEGDIDLIAEGRRATVSFDALPEELAYQGTVSSINPLVADEYARATIVVSNPDGRIMPGMQADVSVQAESFEDQIMVPREAVLEKDGGRTVVLVAEENAEGQLVARMRYVQPGREGDEMVAIVPTADTEMVEPGEVVLVGNHQSLAEGTPIQLAEPQSAAEGGGS